MTLSFAEVDARTFVEPMREFVRAYLVPALMSAMAIGLEYVCKDELV